MLGAGAGIWWLDGADGTAPVAQARTRALVLDGWDVVLRKLAEEVRDPQEAAVVASARRVVGERRSAPSGDDDLDGARP